MAIFTDQTIAGNFDPGVTPVPFNAVIITMTINDANNDGVIRPNSGDQINGSNVTSVWVGDRITLNGVVIRGVTFYTASGGRYFTPSDGSVLTDGTITARTFVNTSTQFPVSGFGPPCFVAGTRVAVPGGSARVEDLSVGDLVITQDNGARPLRWIGRRAVPGRGAFAPVRICAGALGDHDTLLVSPQHRILLSDWRAQMYMGEDEVLCPAAALVNGDTIHRAPRDEVIYVHLMFDDHEIVFAEGLATESFLVGDYLCHETSALREEIIAIFPELGTRPAGMQSARRILRGYEGIVMSGTAEADRLVA